MAVGNQATDDVDHEISGAAMPGMLNLGDVLELVKEGFDNGTLASQQLVGEPHQVVFHVASGFGKDLDAIGLKELLCERFGDIAAVSEDLAIEVFKQGFYRFAVVSIARGDLDIEQLTLVIDHQMEFESKEPVNRGFAPSR